MKAETRKKSKRRGAGNKLTSQNLLLLSVTTCVMGGGLWFVRGPGHASTPIPARLREPENAPPERTQTGTEAELRREFRHRLSQATEADGLQLLKDVGAVSDPELRRRLFEDLAADWLANHRPSLLVLLKNEASSPLARELVAALRMLLPQAAHGAAEMEGIGAVIEVVARRLAETDTATAMLWAKENFTGEARDYALTAVAETLATQFPELAAAMLPTVCQSTRRSYLISSLAAAWSTSDGPAALRWATGLEKTDDRRIAIRSSLETLAAKDVELAAECMAVISTDELLPTAQQVGQILAARSIEHALLWGESLTNPRAKESALTGVLQSWGAVEPTLALDYALSKHAENGTLVRSIFQGWMSTDAASAMRAYASVNALRRSDAISGIAAGLATAATNREITNWLSSLTPAERNTAEEVLGGRSKLLTE